ncbi:hypothetical protein MHAS_02313 [Mycolicibacterium hassiacum DSM 44199]|jgi:hypothetical protein|nr:hypothetical protein MHAS_02313 [Mycolicibacterium hassiacum DSM 44199]
MARRGGGSGGFLLFLVILWLIASIPKEIWIVLGITAAVGVVAFAVEKALEARERRRLAAEQRKRAERAARAERERAERIATLGRRNAALLEGAMAAVGRIAASEAARNGWLGEFDFSGDLQEITEHFRRAHDLRKVTDKLSRLDKPSADDRRILAEANRTIAELERVGAERAALIERCALEAQRIDESLRQQRIDAKTAEERAKLHAELSALLYGIEAAPPAQAASPGTDTVLARVQAYRELTEQIRVARETTRREQSPGAG